MKTRLLILDLLIAGRVGTLFSVTALLVLLLAACARPQIGIGRKPTPRPAATANLRAPQGRHCRLRHQPHGDCHSRTAAVISLIIQFLHGRFVDRFCWSCSTDESFIVPPVEDMGAFFWTTAGGFARRMVISPAPVTFRELYVPQCPYGDASPGWLLSDRPPIAYNHLRDLRPASSTISPQFGRGRIGGFTERLTCAIIGLTKDLHRGQAMAYCRQRGPHASLNHHLPRRAGP
jgi:hypothetical protein